MEIMMLRNGGKATKDECMYLGGNKIRIVCIVILLFCTAHCRHQAHQREQ